METSVVPVLSNCYFLFILALWRAGWVKRFTFGSLFWCVLCFNLTFSFVILEKRFFQVLKRPYGEGLVFTWRLFFVWIQKVNFISSRACHQLSHTTAAAKWIAPRKFLANLSLSRNSLTAFYAAFFVVCIFSSIHFKRSIFHPVFYASACVFL